jgi:Domain of unknown function (DUF4180)
LDNHYGKILTMGSVSYFVCPAEGIKLRSDRDAVDLIGEAHGFDWIAIPVERLDPDFFRLKTGVAGAMLQKFVTYGRRVVVVGDISRYVDESASLRDFVVEANRGGHILFVPAFEDLAGETACPTGS